MKIMYCNHCGQTIPDSSRFCNFCGNQIPAITNAAANPDAGLAYRSETRSVAPAPADRAQERVIFTIRPTMIFVYLWYGLAAVIWLAVVAVMGLVVGRSMDWVTFSLILAAGLIVFTVPIYKHIQRRREVYTLTTHKLEFRYGIIAKTVKNVPLRNVQEVTVRASVRQRLMSLGDIIIESASETGEVALKDIHNADHYASSVLEEMRKWN